MAKTEKHVRKSGATTVTREGQIVGNIGSGKTNVPTATRSNLPLDAITVKTHRHSNKSILKATEAFTQLVDPDTIETIWNLTEGQPYVNRLNALTFATKNLSKTARKAWLKKLDHPSVLGVLDNDIDDLAPETLTWIVSEPNQYWRRRIARNTANVETLTKLSQYSDLKIQQSLLLNKALPPELLEKITLGTKDAKILEYVARRTDLTPALINFLAHYDYYRPRVFIARNLLTSPDILHLLGSDPITSVRNAVATNPHTPEETLNMLTTDISTNIRFMAQRNLENR